ncbi:MAG: ATP-binding cassette domain-containing protein [Phycisphaerae bacterium]|jgi:ABC-type sugar transport system ATPase subunit
MLRVEDLERRIGGFRLAVEEWCVERGSYVVVIGPSGSGKTMLLESLAGLQRPRSGRVWIDGRDVTHVPAERRGIGLVYQDCWLFPHLTVRQNIHFGHRYHRTARKTLPNADALAEMLHIAHLLDRRPEGLSAGERQRVALARALAIRPRLLFLDEPLGTLDPVMREHVAREILACHRDLGMTTIHVTHDHTEARVIGDAAAVLLAGRLQQYGGVDEVFNRPKTTALARFLGCENLVESRATASRTPGRVLVRAGAQTLELASPILGPVAVCIRPEDVHVAAAAAGESAPLPAGAVRLGEGTVTELSLRGPQVRVVCAADGVNWVSLVGRSEWAHKGLATGVRVALTAPARAVHLIALEAGPCL